MNTHRELNNKIANSKTPEEAMRAIAQHVMTPEAFAQGNYEVKTGKREGYEIRATQVPLDLYLKRNNITHDEYRAGTRLHADWCRSGQLQRMTANLSETTITQQQLLHASEIQREAYLSYREAMNSINGTMGKLMAYNVCCIGEWIKDINYMPYKHDQAMPRFREALSDLVNFYTGQKEKACTSSSRELYFRQDELSVPVAQQ